MAEICAFMAPAAGLLTASTIVGIYMGNSIKQFWWKNMYQSKHVRFSMVEQDPLIVAYFLAYLWSTQDFSKVSSKRRYWCAVVGWYYYFRHGAVAPPPGAPVGDRIRLIRFPSLLRADYVFSQRLIPRSVSAPGPPARHSAHRPPAPGRSP